MPKLCQTIVSIISLKIGLIPKKKKKGVITFCPINYNALTLSPHELSTMTFDLIKLLSYDTFSISVSQKDGQQRKIFFFFFHFCPYFRRV
jgi:hypothetical protein